MAVVLPDICNSPLLFLFVYKIGTTVRVAYGNILRYVRWPHSCNRCTSVWVVGCGPVRCRSGHFEDHRGKDSPSLGNFLARLLLLWSAKHYYAGLVLHLVCDGIAGYQPVGRCHNDFCYQTVVLLSALSGCCLWVWVKFLMNLQFAINTAIQDSTGFSPAQLNFSRELRRPQTVYEDQGLDLGTRPGEPNQLKERIEETILLVKTNMAKATIQQAKYYNLRRRPWFPDIGEQVYKRMFPQSCAQNKFTAKLAPSFSGPFVVDNYISPTVLELRPVNGDSRTYRVHIKDIKAITQPSQ